MKFNKTLLAAVIAGLSLASGAAHAVITSPTATGGSALFFSVLDTVNSNSYQVNLNVTDQAFLAGTTATTFSFNSTAASTFFTAANGHNLTFGIVAADSKFGESRNALFTQTPSANLAGLLAGPFANTNSVSTGYASAVASWFTTANTGIITTNNTKGGNGFDSLSTSTADTYNATKAGFGPNMGGKLAIGTQGSFPDQVAISGGTGIADFVAVSADSSGVSQTPVLLGQWTLNYTSSAATLSFSTPAAVPVPAAAWMMLTGLVAFLPKRNKRTA